MLLNWIKAKKPILYYYLISDMIKYNRIHDLEYIMKEWGIELNEKGKYEFKNIHQLANSKMQSKY